MRLRGLTLEKDIVYFEVQDVPILLNDKMIALFRRPGSPIIMEQSISRGPDDGEFYETDFVFAEGRTGVVGYVVYTDGFYVWCPDDDSLMPIRSTEGLRFVPNTQMYRLRDMEDKRSRIRFGYERRRFAIERIIYYKDNELYITVRPSGSPIIISGIKVGSGVCRDGLELLYDEVLDIGKVVMHEYRPALQLPDGTIKELEGCEDVGSTGNTES